MKVPLSTYLVRWMATCTPRWTKHSRRKCDPWAWIAVLGQEERSSWTSLKTEQTLWIEKKRTDLEAKKMRILDWHNPVFSTTIAAKCSIRVRAAGIGRWNRLIGFCKSWGNVQKFWIQLYDRLDPGREACSHQVFLWSTEDRGLLFLLVLLCAKRRVLKLVSVTVGVA